MSGRLGCSKPTTPVQVPRVLQARPRERGFRACRGADEAEALAIIEGSAYGLLTSVFTRDLARGLRFAESARAGWVNINEGTNYWESHLPFGGRAGSQGGLGRVGGRFSIERLTELKTIVVNLA
jgi:acyl-CoA reductase-like NAD-dependent aldehyde dehydrogenase